MPAVSLVTTGRLLVDLRLRPVGYVSYCTEEGSIDGGEVIDRCLFATNYVGEPSAVLFRRSRRHRDSTSATRTCSIWRCGFICWSREGWLAFPSR